jgi:gamma-glutamylcyclotransferase (GGCT)/AIG2-like uncharacterized protein YtfP
MEQLFAYGTLQLSQVQKMTFGRILEGRHDILTGYYLDTLPIDNPEIIELSGNTVQPILNFSGKLTDTVHGTIYEISYDELMKADQYAIKAYQRIEATFHSGQQAWVYVAAAS